MKKTFKGSMRIELTDYDTGQIKVFRIVRRDGELAILKDSKNKAFYAKIRKVNAPAGECLDVTGFNALFSHDLNLAQYMESTQDEKCGRPSKRARLNMTAVIDALNDNRTAREAARAVGVSLTTLRDFMREHGLKSPHRPRCGRQSSLSEADIEWIQKALFRHISIRATATAAGVSPTTMSKFVKKHGIIVPTGSKPKMKE